MKNGSPLKHSRKRKKSYLLLELLICFSLVSICILPIVYRPLQISKACLKAQEIGEWMRQSDLILADFKTALYRGDFSWDELPQIVEGKWGRWKLPPLLIQPGFGGNRKMQVDRVVECRSMERVIDGQDARILILKVTFQPFHHSKREIEKKIVCKKDGEDDSILRAINVFEYRLIVNKKILQTSVPKL